MICCCCDVSGAHDALCGDDDCDGDGCDGDGCGACESLRRLC